MQGCIRVRGRLLPHTSGDFYCIGISHILELLVSITLHCVSKKVPTFRLSVTLSNLNRFSKFLHCSKAYEICYKTHTALPPYLRHVATLPWEIKNSNFLQMFSRYGRNCKQVAFLSPLTLLLIHKF